MPSGCTVTPIPVEAAEINMNRELDYILAHQRLMPLFMPVVNTQQRSVLGYEALIRGPASSPLHSPISLFRTAQRCGRLLELELLCREMSMRRFKHQNLHGKLFLNVTPATLLEPDFRSGMTLKLMDRVGFDADRVVIEITEQFPIDDYDLMKEATSHYRQLGFEVALDDLGAGYSGLRSWAELCPQYVKIDRHFIEGIDAAIIKQKFVRSIIEVARSIQCQVIAEGIERIEEHLVLNELGLKLQQGYYFSRPTALPPKELDQRLFRFSNGSAYTTPLGSQQNLVAITRLRPPLSANCSLGDAVEVFRRHPKVHALAVVDNDIPVGLLSREASLDVYLTPFGRELHDRRAVSEYMDSSPLTLEERTGLEALSDRITRSSAEIPRSDFIVTSQGKYLGTASIMDLLKLITEHQIRNARHANPLTLLPGNVPASEEISRRLKQKAPFVVCYVDMDNFKAFNDRYGYERGDQLILFLSGCIRQWVDDSMDLLCHIGGDDFLVIFGSSDWHQRTDRFLSEFNSKAANYYDGPDRAEGGISCIDRNGDERFFPVVSLSVGAALPDPERCSSHHEVAQLATDAKRLAKQRAGNALFINRRHGPDRQQFSEPECHTG